MRTTINQTARHAGTQPAARVRVVRNNAPFQAAIDFYRLDVDRWEGLLALPSMAVPEADATTST